MLCRRSWKQWVKWTSTYGAVGHSFLGFLATPSLPGAPMFVRIWGQAFANASTWLLQTDDTNSLPSGHPPGGREIILQISSCSFIAARSAD